MEQQLMTVLDNFRYVFHYLMAVDFSQPVSWLLIVGFASLMIGMYHFEKWAAPYVAKINGFIDQVSDKIFGID